MKLTMAKAMTKPATAAAMNRSEASEGRLARTSKEFARDDPDDIGAWATELDEGLVSSITETSDANPSNPRGSFGLGPELATALGFVPPKSADILTQR